MSIVQGDIISMYCDAGGHYITLRVPMSVFETALPRPVNVVTELAAGGGQAKPIDDLSRMKKYQLAVKCKELGLSSCAAKKEDLAERLRKHYADNPSRVPIAASSGCAYDKMLRCELLSLAISRGIKREGRRLNKPELIQLLQEKDNA
jgi:hypothetical protein